MNVTAAKEFILNSLKENLAENLYYHGFHHTLDVAKAVERICESEQVNGKDKELLLTAAYYHDCGFLAGYKGHEAIGCEIAKDSLAEFDFTDKEIEIVCRMIMATRIPQSPKNKLEEIICDADLDYLGRDDFYVISNNLFREFKEYGVVSDEQEWNRLQIDFLSKQHFFTKTAINERQARKEQHLAEIKEIVKNY